MSGKGDRKPTLSGAGQRAAEQRQQRLAAALRENLRRRKARCQAGSAVPQASAPASGDEAADDGKD
jgi:hypothetical protein